MVELSNTTVNTTFSITSGDIVITGSAVISRDNKVVNLNSGSIAKGEKNICNGFYASREMEDKLYYSFDRVDIAEFAEVAPVLQGLDTQIVEELLAASKTDE